MLSAFVDYHQTDWDVYLPIELFVYRVSQQSSTGESLFEMLYGRTPRLAPISISLQIIIWL